MELIEDRFFYQASLTLCKHLRIDSLLADSRRLLRQHSPIDTLVFTIFHLDRSILETVSIADHTSVRKVSVKIAVSGEIAKKINEIGAPIQVARRSSSLLPAKLLTRKGILAGDASVAIIRLVTESGIVCLLFCASQAGQEIVREHGPLLTGLRPIFTVAADNCLKAQKVLLKQEELQEDIGFLSSFHHDHIGTEVVGSDMGLKLVMAEVRSAAASDDHVAISGEQGVGKKFMAQIIHQLSVRQNRPFIEINCHSTSASQLEKLFFGNETHMVHQRQEKDKGMLARAAGGTVYLKGAERISEKLQKRVQEVIRNKVLNRCNGQQQTQCDIRFVTQLSLDGPSKNLLH
ncbi:MAG: sigma 54-interacting transcriptional regulator, partial [Deltaproteobacteria bacterium]|nr:sigma 54-interacting transcriptional regulator [Deltaproteobacteria bacterium]